MTIQSNEELCNYVYQKYAPPLLFSVISWGCAASKWLSVVLNSHPDIFCVHDQRFFWQQFAGSRDISDIEYLKIVGMQGHGHLLAGDVHGITRFSIEQLKNEFGDAFRCAVVVRHPLERAFSAVRLWNEFEPDAMDLNYLAQEEYSPLQQFLTTREAKLFAHALKLSTAIKDELRVGPVFRCEDLTTNPEAIWKLISHISNGTIQLESGISTAMHRQEKINQHRPHNDTRVEDWHLELLNSILDKESRQAYVELGYKLD